MKNSAPFFYVLFFLLVGCSPKVVHYVNSSAPFSKYASFVTVNYKVNQTELSNEGRVIFDQIASKINDQMNKRGYVRNQSNPDMIVRFELISNQVTQSDINTTSFYSPIPRTYITTRTFLESALLIEINDRETKKLIWQASVDLKKYSKKDETEAILQEAIKQLYNTYPYKAGSNTPDESLIEQ